MRQWYRCYHSEADVYDVHCCTRWTHTNLRSLMAEAFHFHKISLAPFLQDVFKIYLSLYLISYLIPFIYMFTLIKRNWILSNILLFFKTRWNIWRFLWRLFFGWNYKLYILHETLWSNIDMCLIFNKFLMFNI